MKICTKCKKKVLFSGFYKHKKSKDGLAWWCKNCCNKINREWARNHPERVMRTVRRWEKNNPNKVKQHVKNRNKKRMGLPVPQYNEIFKKQKGVCKICGLPELKKDLAIDHNHITGQFRGLLCENCNRALGLFKTDPLGIWNLQMAIKYLGVRL